MIPHIKYRNDSYIYMLGPREHFYCATRCEVAQIEASAEIGILLLAFIANHLYIGEAVKRGTLLHIKRPTLMMF